MTRSRSCRKAIDFIQPGRGLFDVRVIFASLLAVMLASCASQQKYMGHPVSQKSFMIAGGETVTLPVTAAGPIPAENEQFKIEVAGFSVGPSKVENGKKALIWGFALTNKVSVKLESVVVEEVAPTNQPKILVSDSAPESKNGVWRGSAQEIIPSAQTTPWLFENGTSTFIYRFSIKPKNAPVVVLYQPSSFAVQSKAVFRQMIGQ